MSLRDDPDLRSNPPWLAKAIAKSLPKIQAEVPAKLLPKISRAKADGSDLLVSLTEYGCGAYGCVIASLDESVVIKVTTDPSEAQFVATGMDWGWPLGITTYFGAMKLEGTYRLSDKKGLDFERQAWVLWREAAAHVGKLDLATRLPFEDSAAAKARIRALNVFDALYRSGSRVHAYVSYYQRDGKDPDALYQLAKERRDEATVAFAGFADGKLIVGGQAWQQILSDIGHGTDAALDVAANVEAYHIAAMALTELGPHMEPVGSTLLWYLQEHQSIMADLHLGNFGLVTRDAGPAWVIIDPGHVVSLPSAW